MAIAPVGSESVAAQVEKFPDNNQGARPGSKPEDVAAVSPRDSVKLSEEGRKKAAEMQKEQSTDGKHDEEKSERTSFSMRKQGKGQSSNSEKEDAVDELKDTSSELRKKEDALREAKTIFIGSEEEQAKKIKELKQDINDLEDTKKELESQLAT